MQSPFVRLSLVANEIRNSAVRTKLGDVRNMTAGMPAQGSVLATKSALSSVLACAL